MRAWRFWWTQSLLILVGVIEPYQGLAHADPVESTIVNYAVAAAPVVCQVLGEDPTMSGVAGLMQIVVEKSGLTLYQAGEVVALSVVTECPWHTALLKRIAATYTPQQRRSA